MFGGQIGRFWARRLVRRALNIHPHSAEQWPDYMSGRSRVTWPSDKALFNFSIFSLSLSLSAFFSLSQLRIPIISPWRSFAFASVPDFTCRCLASARRINWHPLNANPTPRASHYRDAIINSLISRMPTSPSRIDKPSASGFVRENCIA